MQQPTNKQQKTTFPSPPYTGSRCQTRTNSSIAFLIPNLPPRQRRVASWPVRKIEGTKTSIHCCSCVSAFKYKFKQFFLGVMMDPRKIGIKCARHFMTGAEHLLSIFYSGFHCKKAPSPKLHSFPFPRGEEGIRRILFQLPGVRPGLASHQQRSMNP